MNATGYKLLWLLTLLNLALLIYVAVNRPPAETASGQAAETVSIPDMIGTWTGPNDTVSELKGYRHWGEKTIHITEQKDRRFRGTFTYADGTKNFFGVVFPDNRSFVWVAPNSHGYNFGRILGPGHISACYLESWEQATAGCAELRRVPGDVQ